MEHLSYRYFNLESSGGKYESLVIPATLWSYMKHFGWEVVHSNVKNSPSELGRSIPSNSVNFQQSVRGHYAMMYGKFFRLRGKDRYRNIPYMLIRRRVEFSQDEDLNYEYNKFLRNFLRRRRLLSILAWRPLWILVRLIFCAIFVLGGLVFASLSGLFNMTDELGIKILDVFKQDPSVFGSLDTTTMKVLAVVLIVFGALILILGLARYFHCYGADHRVNAPGFSLRFTNYSYFIKHHLNYCNMLMLVAQTNGYKRVRLLQYQDKNLMNKSQQHNIVQGRIIREAMHSYQADREGDHYPLYF